MNTETRLTPTTAITYNYLNSRYPLYMILKDVHDS